MQKIPEKMDVLLVQRADASFSPPTINQANILAKEGFIVGLLDGGCYSDTITALHSSVLLFRPFRQRHNGSNMLFVKAFRKVLQEHSPGVCIAFDVTATALLGLIAFKGKKVFHYHEHPGDYYGKTSLSFRLQNIMSMYFSKKSEMVVIPDSHRASAYYRENCLHHLPYIVRNCPAKLNELPRGKLKATLEEMGINKKWVVVFQGGVSSNLYSDLIVSSMTFWPEDSVMVFIGPVSDEERKKLKNNAISLGVFNRVVLFGQVPYADLFSYTVDADIALTMIKPVTFNYIYMAGASNKRYDAMACGIPQVSNLGPGMRELIEDNGIGLCIDPEDPENIGKAVSDLLLNPERRSKMSKKARSLHLTRFNYEQEFQPMLSKILKWCRESNEG